MKTWQYNKYLCIKEAYTAYLLYALKSWIVHKKCQHKVGGIISTPTVYNYYGHMFE